MNSHTRFLTLIALLSLLVGALAACGGGDDDDSGAVDPGSNGSDSGSGGSDSGSDTETDDDGDEDDRSLPSFGAGGTARVTFGDETFEPILANRDVNGTPQLGFCRIIFGGLQVFGFADTDDGRRVSVEMWIPPTDWESKPELGFDPPRIQVEIEGDPNGGAWLADQERFDDNSRVDDYESDGKRANGTMTLRREFSDELPPVQGTFEVNCEQ